MSAGRPAGSSRRSGSTRRHTDAASRRRAAARRARNAPAPGGRAAPHRDGLGDADLPPAHRGPVRAFVRDAVDVRRGLVGLFLPVLGAVVICVVSPASDLQWYLLVGSLVLLTAVAADAVWMGVEITRGARAAFPGEPVPGVATGWYAFLRAHRSRRVRRPPPRVQPGLRGAP